MLCKYVHTIFDRKCCFCAMVVDCLKPTLTHSLSVKLSLNCCSSVLKITRRGIAKLLHANN